VLLAVGVGRGRRLGQVQLSSRMACSLRYVLI
jgi:hypothetical protein